MSYKDDVLQELDEGYAHFKQTFAGLSDAQMNQVFLGEWSVKDILAHVAGWHREMGSGLERISRGERPVPEGVDYSDGDGWNAKFAAEKKSTPAAQVVSDLDSSFQSYRRAASMIGEDRFEQGRTADRIVHTSGINHYLEHAPQIKEWREGL